MSVSIPYCSKNIRGQAHLGAIKPKTKRKKRVRQNDLSKRAPVKPQTNEHSLENQKRNMPFIFSYVSV